LISKLKNIKTKSILKFLT